MPHDPSPGLRDTALRPSEPTPSPVDHRSWELVEEICSARCTGRPEVQMLLQKGLYHYPDGRPPEVGYRLVWRENGAIHVRPPVQDDLGEIDALFHAARARGWQ